MHKWPGPFISMEAYPMPKDWLSYEQQVELLGRRGMRIDDEASAG